MKSVLVILFGIMLISFIIGMAYAGTRTAVSKNDKNVTFTVTDNPCTFFPDIPQGAPVKEASAYDALKNETIKGCALDYGTQIEF